MDLRSGETIWRLKHGPPHAYAPLQENIECEVAIVGGGITGALIAYEIVGAGFDCVLIDKGAIGGGSTSASTALLSYELDTPLCELTQQIGEADAAACYLACRDSIGKIENLVGKIGDGCDFVRRRSVYLAECESHVETLEREHAIRRKHGMHVDLLYQQEIEGLFSFTRPAALLCHDAADIDVVAFVNALMKAAVRNGLHAYGGTGMARYKRSSTGFVLLTETNHRIIARTLVFATGYESEKYLGRKVGTLKSTYAIATHSITEFCGWPEQCLLWTSARPYLYLRTTADQRAIIGGEDVDFQDEKLRDSLLPAKASRLEDSFHRMFPAIDFQVACTWTGTFGESEDSLAFIGEPAALPGAYFALGYGGNGIAYSMIAAEIIRDACLGGKNSVAHLFRIDR